MGKLSMHMYSIVSCKSS